MATTTGKLLLALTAINALSGVGSAIWLACLGQWQTIAVGTAAAAAGSFVFALAVAPAAMLERRAAAYPAGVAGLFLNFLSLAYLHTIVALWALGMLWFFLGRVTGEPTLVPVLIWSYGAAGGAWTFRALCEALADDEAAAGSAVIAVCLAAGYAVMAGMLAAGGASLGPAAAFAGIMLLGVVVSLFRTAAGARPKQA